jgi:hypothetical protein
MREARVRSASCFPVRQRTDEDPIDSVGVHVHDLKMKAQELERLGDPGDMPELGDDEAGQRMIVADRKLAQLEELTELVEREAPVDQPRSVLASDHARLLVVSLFRG